MKLFHSHLGRLLLYAAAGVGFFVITSCGALPVMELPEEDARPVDAAGFRLLTRFVHLSDTHIMDEESPARLAALGDLSASAWRPNEAYSTQILDGFIRTINQWHVARAPIDFVVVTGDALDNMQRNELRWLMTCFDGGNIDPQSGPDDRPMDERPPPLLDPYHPFTAQGLYQRGVHGDSETIDWYMVMGNHDRFAQGTLPVVFDFFGHRVAPIPVQSRLGLFLPLLLNPLSAWAFSPISPAFPLPRPSSLFGQRIEPNMDRAFITNGEFVRAHHRSRTSPTGHGFDAQEPKRTWYGVSPVPGLRLVALNSSTPAIEQPALLYSEGAISVEQVSFLAAELERAEENDEIVILATHHPATSLQWQLGTALTASNLVPLLQRHPLVRLHLAGHWHVNAVMDRTSYLEMVTGSTLDAPQLARVVEIWRSADDVEIRYRYLSHLERVSPVEPGQASLFDDPLFGLREIGNDLAILNPP